MNIEGIKIDISGKSKEEIKKEVLEQIEKTLDEKLPDKEKEMEFLNYIGKNGMPTVPGIAYFSDNDDMRSWYNSYVRDNRKFENLVFKGTREYNEFDIATVWPDIKDAFINTIKRLRKIPRFGEANINGIDARIIYEKLMTFEPEFNEKLLLHLETYNKKGLTIDDRVNELLSTINTLGYIPYLQECRFSDGTDMFTWYNKYKNRIPKLENRINLLINKEEPKRKVNIYFIPNFRSTGGKFYTICANYGEKLDLSEISTYEEAFKLDNDLIKRGGLILKQDEEINSVSFVKGKSK